MVNGLVVRQSCDYDLQIANFKDSLVNFLDAINSDLIHNII